MADLKLSELSAQTSATGTDIMELVRAAQNYKITVANLAASILATDAELAAIAGLTSAADKVPYFTGSGTASLATLTSFARTLLDDTDAATARATLEVPSSTTMQLYDNTVSGSSVASWDITSISGSYNHLRLIVYARGTQSATNVQLGIRFNNDSGSNYSHQFVQGFGSTAQAGESLGNTSAQVGDIAAGTAPSGEFSPITIDIANYTTTSGHKVALCHGTDRNATGTGGLRVKFSAAAWFASSAAITRITLTPSAGNIDLGSRVTLYGIT